MSRRWKVWSVFAIGVLVASAAMAGISRTVLRLDREGAQARRQAVIEENVRLALWRMDAALSLFIARENLRPYFEYRSFIPVSRPWIDMFRPIVPEEEMLASPLLGGRPEHVRLNFEIEPDGIVSSPQVPPAMIMNVAMERRATDPVKVEEAVANLKKITSIVHDLKVPGVVVVAPAAPEEELAYQNTNAIQAQVARSDREYAVRSFSTNNGVTGFAMRKLDVGMPGPVPNHWAAESLLVPDSVMVPVWKDGELFLVRSINASGIRYVQGAWLDWSSLSKWLLSEVHDLLPNATLLPASATQASGERRLAALPLNLVPGAFEVVDTAGGAPVSVILVIAWTALGIVAFAIGLLLRGTLELSERRGAFVSAVTHELRTPLTTFRMYTEMLGEGMVPEKETQQTYLNTLRREAERLSHLVENVLSYSRIEESRAPSRVEPVAARDLLDRIEPRLHERAEQGQFRLVVERAAVDGLSVRIDLAAAEQILLNLVDNACKYAASAEDRRLHLTVTPHRKMVHFAVRDHGPGIPTAIRRRLFQPFSKSAAQAAVSAPGVGLGLALCRQLARSRHGDLRYADVGGAEFTLIVPAAMQR